MNKEFTFEASELSAFANTFGTFIISLKNGNIVHYTPEDEAAFYEWLQASNVREVDSPVNN